MALASGVGLISGLNFDDIITRISAANQRPVNLLRLSQSRSQSKIASYESINRKLIALNDALGNLKDVNSLKRADVWSSDTSVVRATGSGSAVDGTYTVKVNQLAQADRRASQGMDDTDTVIASGGGGVFAFKIGDGVTESITVDASMTLAQLRDAINAADEGVRASIINDGSESNAYRLTLTVESTGADNSLTITSNNTTLDFANTTIEEAVADSDNGFDGTVASSGTYTGAGTAQYVVEVTTGGGVEGATFKVSTDGGMTWGADDAFTASATPVDIGDGIEIAFTAGATNFSVGDRFSIDAFDPIIQQAQNASMTVDGITVQRDTNTFDNVIEGVTLTSVTADAEAVTLTVSVDEENAQAPILSFVGAYNDLILEINRLSSYDPETQTGGPLFGDSGVNSIRNQLTRLATSRIDGLDSDRLGSISEIGITLNALGTLDMDSSKVREALNENFEDVVALFAVTGRTESESLAFVSATDRSLSGGSFLVNVLTAPEQANVTGANVIHATNGLTADEALTFTVGDINLHVNLQAGDLLAEIIEKINDEMLDEGTGIVAFDDGGQLGLRTEVYGSDAEIDVESSLDGAGQTGIGTAGMTDEGVDVAGTINGIVGSGNGQILTGPSGSDVEGLNLRVLADSVGNAGSIDVTFGLAEQLSWAFDDITDSENGLIKVRTDGLTQTIEDINDRIVRIEERISNEASLLRAQFRSMEIQLASMQSQSNFLASSLANIAQIKLPS